MSQEIPSIMLAPGQRRAPRTVSMDHAPSSFQAHFATGVRPQSHLSQTNSTTYNSIFWVNVAFCRILSHHRGLKASNFAKFEAPQPESRPVNVPVAFSSASWKACGQPPPLASPLAAANTQEAAVYPLFDRTIPVSNIFLIKIISAAGMESWTNQTGNLRGMWTSGPVAIAGPTRSC
jgi:hypothetical protein